jgi:hypothetical protein
VSAGVTLVFEVCDLQVRVADADLRVDRFAHDILLALTPLFPFSVGWS